MERITSFIYCLNADRIQAQDQVTINAMGVLASLTPEYMPGTFSFSVIFSVLGLQKKNYNLVIKFFNPDGEVIVDTNNMPVPYDSILDADPNKDFLPLEQKGLTMSLDFRNVVFLKEGNYKTIVYCDGTEMGEYQIYAKGKHTIS